MLTKLTTAIVAACALVGPAHAASADQLVCNVQDTAGGRMTYLFGPNTTNVNGSFGGTMVEAGFEKNGRMIFSERGMRPIWIYAGNQAGGFTLYSRNDWGWSISVASDGVAILRHGDRFAANGSCRGGGPTAGNVSDQGR
jgi:hypothetical protein